MKRMRRAIGDPSGGGGGSAPVVTNGSFNISSTASIGTNVGTMTATNSPTSWSIISGNTGGFFTISSSGVITVAIANPTSGTYTLTVQATNGSGSGTGTATILSAALPSGVTLRPIDGGQTYYASNGFTAATTYPSSITYTSGGGAWAATVSYSNGWDDPQFFPMGGFLNDPTDTSAPSGVTMYTDLHWNTLFSCQSNSNLTNWFNAGLSLMAQNNELFNAQGSPPGSNNGILYNNGIAGGPYNTGIAKCIISACITDEPAYESCWKDPIGGLPTDNIGGVGGVPGQLTNAIIDGRPFWTNMAGFSWIITANRGRSPSDSTQISQIGTLASPTPMNTLYPTLNSTTRNPFDLTGADAYFMPLGRYAAYWGVTLANAIEGQFTATAFTMLEACRGSHQGLWIDYFRNFCTANLGTAGYTRPLTAVMAPAGNAVINIPALQGMQETNWECWSTIVHGARYLVFFDHDDQTSLFNRSRSGGFMQPSGAPQKGTLAGPDTKLNQTVTFTGQIDPTTKVLTVSGLTSSALSLASGSPGGMYLHPGMEIVSINGVTQSPPIVIQTQLTFANEGTFTGVFAANASAFGAPFGLLTVSSLTGFIPVPAILVAPGTGGLGPTNHNSGICGQESGTVNGAGTYTILNGGGTNVSSSSGWIAWAPGLNGTYQLSGGTAGSPVTMIAKQSDVQVFGQKTTNAGTGNYYNQIAATCATILDLAPVINSQFAVGTKTGTNGYVLPTSTSTAGGSTVPFRYIFPYAVLSGALQAVPHPYGDGIGTSAARTFALQQGIDCCVHYYQGSTYTSRVSGESITTNTFYIIATTSYAEDTQGGISATFRLADTSVTTATVIGEARSITISGGVFTDTFDYPWTVHVYKLT